MNRTQYPQPACSPWDNRILTGSRIFCFVEILFQDNIPLAPARPPRERGAHAILLYNL
jgi:hypothetical protein